MGRIVHKYKDVDVVCGHCNKKTRTLNAIKTKNKITFCCNKCAENKLNKK